MIINLNNLKLPPNQAQDLHFEQRGSAELLESWGGKFKQPFVVDGILLFDEKNYLVQGSVHTQVELGCSRCLKPVTYTVNADFSALLIKESLQDEADLVDEDVVVYTGGMADLTPLIEGIIVSEIPMSLLCSEDCKGLCAICGSNLNTKDCGCREDNIDPRWEKLKQLT